MKFTIIERLTAMAIVGIIVLVPVTWVFKSHMEAQAYNRLTGADATTWEAMWGELRVQDAPDRIR